MTIPLRPLGLIKTMVEAIGLDVSYVYDDLVFIEKNAFLLQMSEERGDDLWVWFNTDSTPDDRPLILSRLQSEGAKLSLQLQEKGTYSMQGFDGEESFQLQFTSAPKPVSL